MKKIFNLFKFIIKTIWNAINMIRKLFLNLIALFLIYMFFHLIMQSSALPTYSQGALLLNIDAPIVEKPTLVSEMKEAFALKEQPSIVLFELINVIDAAINDPKVTGIVLQLNGMPKTSLTTLRAIGRSLTAFKASGKKIYAVGDNYSQSQYYLASFADEVMLSTQGTVLLEGMGSYHLYYKSFLDTLKVSTHIFRVGTYKSYVEPFIRDDMSSEAKENSLELIHQIWRGYVADVAKNRELNPQELMGTTADFVEKLRKVGGNLAQFAIQQKLVDKLMTRAQMRDALATVFGKEGEDSYQNIGYRKYAAILNQKTELAEMKAEALSKSMTQNKSKIAVVTVDGAIIDGESKDGMVGGDTIAKLLRDAKNDADVKAVILRVNSPGGSAFASEMIRQEIDELQKRNKIVVVSMGSVAASGGYWIASSADSIIAQPTTITGSIGIFGVFATFEKTLASLGIHSDGAATSDFAGLNLAQALPESVEQFIQLTVENGYHQFITLVSKHRNIPMNQMDQIAQGRVWTGEDAKRLGLVDALGDFNDALRATEQLAELKEGEYTLDWKSVHLSIGDLFKQMLNGNNSPYGISMGQTIKSFIGHSLLESSKTSAPVVKKAAEELTLFGGSEDPNGRYIYCLNCLVR